MTYNGAALEADTRCGVLRAIEAATAALEFPGVELPAITRERPHAISIRLRTTSLNDLRAILARNDVAHHEIRGHEIPDRVLVAPHAAGNVILDFVQSI